MNKPQVILDDTGQPADINAVYLSQIETGKRTGSARTLAALAKALQVTVDDQMAWPTRCGREAGPGAPSPIGAERSP